MKIAEITTHSLSPVLADVRLRLEGDFLPGDEVRGRVTGPRCPGVTTVEIAYPLKALAAQPTTLLQLVIPEPTLWEAARPFTYEGLVEHWRGGMCLERVALSVGLRKGPK